MLWAEECIICMDKESDGAVIDHRPDRCVHICICNACAKRFDEVRAAAAAQAAAARAENEYVDGAPIADPFHLSRWVSTKIRGERE